MARRVPRAVVSADPDRYRRWFREESEGGSVLLAAATVILLRDRPGGPEVLMMRRNSKIAFGGMWVFPGGRLDPEDYPDTQPDDVFTASSAAAVREAKEEADLDLDHERLVRFSHWTPPPIAPKRYATWFFLADAPAADVTVDDGEITDHDWMTPAEALARRDRLEIELAPPTFVTLHELGEHGSVDAALSFAADREPPFYETRIHQSEAGPVAVWQGDAAYDSGELDTPGRRHRLLMGSDRWELARD